LACWVPGSSVILSMGGCLRIGRNRADVSDDERKRVEREPFLSSPYDTWELPTTASINIGPARQLTVTDQQMEEGEQLRCIVSQAAKNFIDVSSATPMDMFLTADLQSFKMKKNQYKFILNPGALTVGGDTKQFFAIPKSSNKEMEPSQCTDEENFREVVDRYAQTFGRMGIIPTEKFVFTFDEFSYNSVK